MSQDRSVEVHLPSTHSSLAPSLPDSEMGGAPVC